MFRIRRIPDALARANADAVKQAEAILHQHFPFSWPAAPGSLSALLAMPASTAFRPFVLVAEDAQERVRGVALARHAADLDFLYLDYIAADVRRTGTGIGGALYQRVRELARNLGAIGVFLEAQPDDPALCPDHAIRAENASRLRFYARFGAYPVIGTAYETPLPGAMVPPPYLVYDALGSDSPLAMDAARRIVRALLERKYGADCPPGYVDAVVASFRDDPVRLRNGRHRRREVAGPSGHGATAPLPVVANEHHAIHHVRDRGYFEAPVRIRAIRRVLEERLPVRRVAARRFGERHLTAVHAPEMVSYLRRVCMQLPADRAVYPYVFPIRNRAAPPRELPLRAGYWCIDTFTPLTANAWPAARGAADCALTAAALVVEGERFAYALVRPPGHHAEHRAFGGFCYLNNAAIAAQYLSRFGRVAMLDIDYHHGNGQQDIFWRRSDVLTVSIHGHPNIAYPYFTGFAHEVGEEAGRGFNLNLPLPEKTAPEEWHAAHERAHARIRRFAPQWLVLCLGLDTGRGDPTGSWSLRPPDFHRIGSAVRALDLPTVVVQEGGYLTRMIGRHTAAFFSGLLGLPLNHAGHGAAQRTKPT
ncbi:MAG: histone deacetylase family protein [Alphaproteobacteria bacterium]|nr:histone deacetylase family protein [Alphaproteobacteria bacterium]